MKKDNRGLSLIELIVVIGIISIMVGISGLGLKLYSTREAKKTCDNIMYTLENCRMDALAKEYMKVVFWKDSEGVFYTETLKVGGNTTTKKQKIGGASSTVQIKKTDGSVVNIGATEATGEVFKFRRDTGGFADNDEVSPIAPFNIDEIWVSKAGKTYKLKLQKFTGKVLSE